MAHALALDLTMRRWDQNPLLKGRLTQQFGSVGLLRGYEAICRCIGTPGTRDLVLGAE